MAFSKITSAELVDKGVSGLPDVPGLSSADMQKKFDELSKDVVIPKFNKLIEDMESQNGAANIGMEVPEGIEADANTKAVVHALAKQTKENSGAKHGHVNKSVLDLITDTVKKAYDRLVSLFENVTEISDTVVDKSESLPTGKAIVAYVKKMGGGDMATSVYDKNNSGVVDDAEMLGGELPEVFQKTTSEYLETDSKDVVGAINEVNEKAKNGGKDLIADAFSEEIDYDEGVYVTYDNKLWVFTDAKAAGEWNAAVVESVTVGAELSQLTENLTEVSENLSRGIDASNVIALLNINTEWTASEDCYVYGNMNTVKGGEINLVLDGINLGTCHNNAASTTSYSSFSLMIKKGTKIKFTSTGDAAITIRAFKLK